MTLEAHFQQFICTACGFIYDEAVGDPDSRIAPGTCWSQLPESSNCPECGVKKSDYVRVTF